MLMKKQNWILKFRNVAGSMSCVEKEFKLKVHKYEEYIESLLH